MHEFSAADLELPGMDKPDFSRTSPNHEEVIAGKQKSVDTENGEETLRRILGSYEIGQKLRQLRLRKKIALVDLGKQTGLSASMLSQLENGKLIPTLPTLARIAMVFDVGLEYFFADKRPRQTFSIVRKDERMQSPDRADSPAPGYLFEVLVGAPEKSLSAYLAEFPKHAERNAREHVHAGSEFLHILEGTLGIHYQTEEYTLQAGDSVYFDGSEPHSYYGRSDTPARALIITTPPRL
jgi:transcriptional regulator with XRE-family HTH domain